MGAHFINWVIISLWAGSSALVLKPVTDPVISKVGGNVTLEIKPPGVLAAMIWTFSRTGITVVSWAGIKPVIGAGYENRVTLNTATGSVELRSVNLSDAGVYTFGGNTVVSGTLEQITGSVTLEVYDGPEQASITAPDTAAEGSSVTFTCSAQSLPPCNYTWYFNETETAQESQYKIASVSNADRGSYTCVAWNSVTGRNTSVVKEFIVTGLGSLSSGEIAGIVMGTLAGVTGVALGVYFSVKLCRNNPHDLRPGPAQSSPGSVIYENFEGPSASATYENTTAIRRAGEAKNPDSTYTGLQFPDQSTYSTLNRP